MKHKPKHIFEYGCLRTVQFIVGIFPLKWTAYLISNLFKLIFLIAWPEKKQTCARLREVFGADYPLKKMRVIARDSFFNVTMSMIEIMRCNQLSASWFESHYTGLQEALTQVNHLIDKYGGVVLALPHAGNWELAGVVCMHYNVRLMAIARKQNNPLVDRWIARNRQANFEPIDRAASSTLIRIAHHLKSGGAFAILPDVRGHQATFTTSFFGAEIPASKGMARFARMANVPIFPIFATRNHLTHHDVVSLKPVYPDLDADPEVDLLRVTQEVMTQFDAEIRREPGQWFWYNRRWLLTPLGMRTRK